MASVLALALAPAAADGATLYSHVGEFGGQGANPGQFSATPPPQRLAVHEQSGKVIVADRGNNRVQVFDPTSTGASPAFSIAVPRPIGVAIDQASGDLYVSHPVSTAVNEVQAIRIDNATSGTYTLTFNGVASAPIAYNATAAQVQTALRAVSTIGDPNVSVAGAAGNDTLRTRTVTFTGALAGTDVSTLVVDSSGLSSGAAMSVSTTTTGLPASVMMIRKFNPDLAANPTSYTADGSFQSPPVGSAPGQLGGVQVGADDRPNGGGIAVDPVTGDLLAIDTVKNVIQRYESGGWDGGDGFLGSFNGSSLSPARPAFTGLRDIAVTSTGDVIVADVSGSQARVDRFDAGGALQATLSQANNPVPNNILADSGIVVAVNRATDEVFVTSEPSTTILVDLPGRVYQFEDDVLVRDFGVANSRMHGFVFGMAARGSSPGRLYVASNSSHFFDPIVRVQAFDARIPPTAAIASPASVTATGATFSGTVNPQGTSTSWRFEYRRVGVDANWVNQTPDVSAGAGSSDVPVETTVAGLDPTTEYEVRLVATATGGVVTQTNPVGFTTLGARPLVGAVAASFVTQTTAILTGGVNPRSLPTEYRFEYGPDDAYGSSVPAAPDVGDAGDGRARVSVTEAIEGLEPGQTYHFRLVAENSEGEVVSPDRTFTTPTDVPGLGSKRAYELVSYAPTAGVHATRVHAESSDGNRVLYQSDIEGPHAPTVDEPNRWFLAERGSDGWSNRAVGFFQPRPIDVIAPFAVTGSSDLSRLMLETSASADPDDRNLSETLSTENPLLAAGKDLYEYRGGGYAWVSRDPRIEPGTPQVDPARAAVAGSPSMASMSDDGETTVFWSQRQLLDADTTVGSTSRRLYKRDGDGLRFIGIRPDGSVPASGLLLGSSTQDVDYSPNAVSADGKRVAWSARRHDSAADSTSIYIQDDDGPTVEAVRESGVSGLASPHPLSVRYWGADTDVSRVFFTSSSRLTPDSGASNGLSPAHSDLYVYDAGAGEVRSLTPRGDGVEDPGVAPAVADRARVVGVTYVADDGSRAYFVADGQLDAEPSPFGEMPAAAGRNLYVVELDDAARPLRTRFIAALTDGNLAQDAGLWSHVWEQKPAFASSDGALLGFGSIAPLTGTPTAGLRQLFLYDDRTGSLVCPSCPADGSAPTGSRVNGFTESDPFGRWQRAVGERHLVSADGTVFFDTTTALVLGDQNSVRDVYEYRGGELRLVTTGSGTSPARLTGASADGRTVFFLTTEALAPQDHEPDVRKVYAARVGGGFATTTPSGSCIGDECQGSPDAAPAPLASGSADLRGRGNATPVRRPPPRCATLAQRSRSLARQATRARQAARKARGKAAKRRLARRATTLRKQAKQLDTRAKKCRQSNGRAAR